MFQKLIFFLDFSGQMYSVKQLLQKKIISIVLGQKTREHIPTSSALGGQAQAD